MNFRTQAEQGSVVELKTPDGPDPVDLASRVELSLQRLSHLDLQNVHCLVSGGHVTLQGTVRKYDMKQLAQTIAMHVAGVRSITNDIAVPR